MERLRRVGRPVSGCAALQAAPDALHGGPVSTARWTGCEPRRAFFTHICHDLGHERAESLLPPHIRLAYDGLEIQVEAAP